MAKVKHDDPIGGLAFNLYGDNELIKPCGITYHWVSHQYDCLWFVTSMGIEV